MVLCLAVIGFVLISLGSLLVIVAPGDGQTGMFAIPLWFVGGLLGVAAIIFSLGRSGTGRERTWVLVSALLSLASVAWAVTAAMQYSQQHHSQPRENGRDT